MKHSKSLICLMLVLVIAMASIGLTACNKGDDEKPVEIDSYYRYENVNWNVTSLYSVDVTMPEGVTLNDVTKEDFSIAALVRTSIDDYSNSLEVVVKEYTFTKKSDSVLSVSFTNPANSENNVQVGIISNKSVTSDGKGIGCIFAVVSPEFAFTGNSSGMYYGSTSAVVNIEFVGDGTFVSSLDENMFVLPNNLDGATLSVARTSDTTAKLTLTDMPATITTQSVAITVLAEAIDNPRAKNSLLEIEYSHPSVNISNSTITVASNSIEIADISVGGGYSFVKDSVDVIDENDIAVQQSYSSDGKLTLTLSTQKNYIRELICESSFSVKLKAANGEEITHTFQLPLNSNGVSGEIISQDFNERQITIMLSASLGYFADDITAADITVQNTTLLTGLAIESKSKKEIVLTCTYPVSTEKNLVAEFTVAENKFVSGLSDADLVAEIIVPIIDADRDIDWVKLGTKVGMGAASGFGSAVGEAIAGFAMPYVYQFLGVDTSDPQMNLIQSKLDDLTASVDKVSIKIDSVLEKMDLVEYKNALAGFSTKISNLQTDTNTLLTNNDCCNYVKELSSGGQTSYVKFRSLMGSEFSNKVPYGSGISLYNEMINIAKKTEADYYNLAEWLDSNSNNEYKQYALTALRESNARQDNVYCYLVENALPCTSVESTQKFLDTVKLETPKLIADTIAFGNSIIGVDLNMGIVDTYFAACDLIFNFESQTMAMKDAYAYKVFTTYFTAAAFALQYASDSANSINYATLVKQVAAVNIAAEAINAKVEAMKKNAENGLDIVLVNNFVVCKQLYRTTGFPSIYHDLQNYKLDNKRVFAPDFSAANFTAMINRASKRNTTLLQDINSAGFSGLVKNSDGKYFIGRGAPLDETKEDAFVWELLGVFGGTHTSTTNCYLTCVNIEANGAATVKEKLLWTTYVSSHQWIYSSDKKTTQHYEGICLFVSPK